MLLVWKKVPWLHGTRWELTGLPKGMYASAHFVKSEKAFIARAWLSGHSLSHSAGTCAAARQRLSREIDKRSIGLFGLDGIEIRGI